MALYSAQSNIETVKVMNVSLNPVAPAITATYNHELGKVFVVFNQGTAVEGASDAAVKHLVGLVDASGAFIDQPIEVMTAEGTTTYTQELAVTPGVTVKVGVQAIDAEDELSAIIDKTVYTKPSAPVLATVTSNAAGEASVSGTLEQLDGENADVENVSIFAALEGEEFSASATEIAPVADGAFAVKLTGLQAGATYKIVAQAAHKVEAAAEEKPAEAGE